MSLESKITEVLEKGKNDLIKSYSSKGLRASGKFERSLETFFNENNNGFSFGILGANYADIMQNGRLPNRNKDSIRKFVGWAGSTFLKDWVKDKGLTVSPFAVAWKIAREGIKVPNRFNPGGVISDVINDSFVEEFKQIIKFYQIESVKSDVRNILKNGNN